jgi:uncharacterized protein YacL
MTEQRSANAAGSSAGANAESSVAVDDISRSDLAHSITAQGIWRVFIVGIMVAVGIAVGYQAGVAIVIFYGQGAMGDSANTFLADLHRTLQNHYYATVDMLLFPVLGGLAAYLVGSAAFTRIVAIAENVKNLRVNEKVALFVGLLCGLILTLLFGQLLTNIPNHLIGWLLTVFLGVTLIYISIAVTFSMKDSFARVGRGPGDGVYEPSAAGTVTSSQIKILDTNVIIDGRVSDVCRTGFIEGTIYVPGFVLDELQHIADSSDSLKRARGRRGLDILNQMRSELSLLVRSLDAKAEAAPHEEVDSKLVKLAKKLGGAIVTNDFNLNKVAELQGVPVLNINELANALKPVVLPGEEMSVAVIKEGKEMSQGIGYLDDGTMIVIEGARRRIGETLDVVVSSVLQTVAGKMIFAQIKAGHDDGYEPENGDGPQDMGQGPRSYSGGRPRRPFRDR